MNISQAPAKLKTHMLGPHPIIAHFIQRLNLHSIMHECVGYGHERMIDHGEALACLVHNVLDSPAPLYRIAQWAEPIAPQALSLTDDQKRSLNDDRIARMLDALVSERGKNIWFRLALRVIKQFKIETQRVHHDTTSVTFHGQYKGSVCAPLITNGYNKDHRPDLKQFVFGLSVSSDGAVPMNHQVHSGNKTDDKIHRPNLEELRTILGKSDFIYVADGKLATTTNLNEIDSCKGKFVSVLPRTRKEDREFREKLRNQSVRWRRILTIPNKRKKYGPPDIYYACSQSHNTQEGFRLIWIRSSAKALDDCDTRERHLNQARVDIAALGRCLNRRKYRLKRNVRKAVKQILKKYSMEQFIHVTIGTQIKEQTKRLKRGRPSYNDPVRIIKSCQLTLKIQLNRKALKEEKHTDGVFPLVTNLYKLSKKEVLQIYKYQPYVEKRFEALKTELDIAPVYLKKPRRCAGLVHVYYIALVVASLIERSVRQSMKRKGIEKLPLFPEGRKTATPTCTRILEAFNGICWHEFNRANERICFPLNLTPLQKTLLELLDVPKEIYA